jgi:threonine dehydrogenase-like Zn-dependent dehydrogenase
MKAMDAQIDYQPLPNIPSRNEIVLYVISTAIFGSRFHLYHHT